MSNFKEEMKNFVGSPQQFITKFDPNNSVLMKEVLEHIKLQKVGLKVAHKKSQSVQGSRDKGQKQSARSTSKGSIDVSESLNKSQAKI
jgi:hypothetical protein